MQNAKQIFAIAALCAASWSGAASAAAVSSETWFGAEPATAGPARSRAEVLADLALWERAGLQHYSEADAGPQDAQYQQRLAQYQRLRSGPEYQAEVQRQGGAVKAAESREPGHAPG